MIESLSEVIYGFGLKLPPRGIINVEISSTFRLCEMRRSSDEHDPPKLDDSFDGGRSFKRM
ncbi:MAG: hypothetical protein ACTS42_02020 [Candidatus Hodgkinia cicadicola]